MNREKIPEYVVWALVIVVCIVVGVMAIQGMGISQTNRMAEFVAACKALNETLTEGQCRAILALSKNVGGL